MFFCIYCKTSIYVIRDTIEEQGRETMKQAQDITDKNALEWAGKLDNIRAWATEIADSKIMRIGNPAAEGKSTAAGF